MLLFLIMTGVMILLLYIELFFTQNMIEENESNISIILLIIYAITLMVITGAIIIRMVFY